MLLQLTCQVSVLSSLMRTLDCSMMVPRRRLPLPNVTAHSLAHSRLDSDPTWRCWTLETAEDGLDSGGGRQLRLAVAATGQRSDTRRLCAPPLPSNFCVACSLSTVSRYPAPRAHRASVGANRTAGVPLTSPDNYLIMITPGTGGGPAADVVLRAHHDAACSLRGG